MSREDKLPKWARRELENLRMRVAEMKKARSEIVQPWRDDAPICVGLQQMDGYSIEAVELVSFRVDERMPCTRGRIGVEARNDYWGRYINVRGGDSLVVCPESSNCVRIALLDSNNVRGAKP